MRQLDYLLNFSIILYFLLLGTFLGTNPGGFEMYLIKEKSSPFWQIIYFVNGKRTKKSTKKKTKSEALKYLSNFKNNCSKEEEQPKIESISLSKFRDEYIEYIRLSKSKNYLRSVQLSFKQLMLISGDIKLNRLDTRTLDKFFTIVYSRAQNAARLYYRTLKAALSKAVIWNYLSQNPIKKIKCPKVNKSFPVFISEAELHKIINQTDKEFFKNIFYTAFFTGMRLGEILNMKWNWIDFNQDIIIIKCNVDFKTKNKKERIIPINPTLKQILINYIPKIMMLNQDEFVFTRIKGIKLNENFVSKEFKKFVRAAGLNEGIHFHTLRHSFASNLIQRGVSLYVVKELLGHEELSTTEIYSHLQKQNLKEAVNLL
jgi:integrase/recombinase XerD